MRKRLKTKKASCALCKPHKRGWGQRWKPKELVLLKESEKDFLPHEESYGGFKVEVQHN